MSEKFKVSKPDKFSGSDLSLAATTAWAFSIEEYMALANIPPEFQTRVAGNLLSGEALIWYINTYRDVKPLPTLENFLEAFKKHHQATNGEADLITRVETILQDTRTTPQFCNEFKMLIAQLGPKTDLRWTHVHFLRGVDRNVRRAMVPFINGDEKLDDLITKACNIARNNEFGKSLDRKSFDRQSPAPKPRFSPRPTGSTSPSSSTPTPVKSISGKANKFTTKLSEEDRDYLRRHRGCFNCRKLNVDHISTNCPDLPEDVKAREVKKESVSALGAIVESESDSEYPRSVPTIKIVTSIEDTTMSTSLVDCGATINLISSDKVEKHAIPTHPTPPVRIHEPLNPQGVLVNQKVVSKVLIPEENWESSRPAELLVAPLQDNDVILGMPFLASEKILVDPAHGKVILPPKERVKEDDVAEEENEDDEDFDWGYYPARFPSICPKMLGLPKITPTDFSWVAALKDFDSTTPAKFDQKATSTTPTLKEALLIDKNYLDLNQKYISEFDDVFTEKLPDRLPSTDAPRHRIVLEDEKMSLNGRMFRLPTRYWPLMRDFLDEHLAAGRIRRSSSHIASGTWMIPKNDPTAMPRVVHDYRSLNDKTIKDHTPLTRQDDIIERIALGKIRGKIDLTCAYYQILMETTDIHKTAFKTPFGTYEWLVMPQGLCNAVATFQRYMNWVLRKFVGRFCAVYIDDIAIWSDSVEEHKEHVRLILEALREAGICASKKKSVLFADEIHFLGHSISSLGVEPDQVKIDKILGARTPRSVQDIREFNGLVNYVGQFIPGLSDWSTVLSGLTKKNVPFRWETAHEEAFKNIKRLAKNHPILKPIDHDSPLPVMLVADASNRAIGGYYGQGQDYKTMTPAGFHSRALNPAEKNYPTHDKEMLAIVDCLKRFEPQLTGIKFDILTDHAPLTHWKTQKDLSARQVRWNETLSRFNADIHHIPGISNSAADALSRYPYVQPAEDLSVCAISMIEFDSSILKSIRSSLPKDRLFGPVIANPERYPLFQFEEGLLFFEGRLCIPANDRISREKLLKLHHDDAGNHHAIDKTRKSITMDYYWPGVQRDIELYIKSCTSCARNKSATQAPAGFLHPMPIPKARFAEMALDFVGTLVPSKGFDTILVMTDRLTDYVKFEATHSTATAADIADLVYRSWYRQFGLPKAMTSDRDKLFTSGFWKELHKRLRVHLRMSTSYHPETDGSSERSNKTMIESLRHYVNLRQSDWADHLIHVEAAMNNSVNATTGKTPTELVFGTPLRLFPSPRDLAEPSVDIPAVTDYIQRIQDNISFARDRHAEAKTKQTTYANQKRRAEPDYKVGDKVYLETKNLRLRIKKKGRSAKFYPRYVGPFAIAKTEPATSNYTLELPPEYHIHPKVHARRLKLAYDNDPELFPGRIPPNPPPIDADDEQYAVEAILDHRQVGRTRQFLVHWEGYSETEDSWIKEGDIDAEMVRAYLEVLEKEGENEAHKVGKRTTTPSPKRTGGRSARSRCVKKH